MSDGMRRTARLNMRLTPEELAIIRQAARVQGTDVTTFVLAAALEHGRAMVARSENVDASSRT